MAEGSSRLARRKAVRESAFSRTSTSKSARGSMGGGRWSGLVVLRYRPYEILLLFLIVGGVVPADKKMDSVGIFVRGK